MAKILIVEDDNVIADGMARHLVAAGFDPVVVGRGELGLARLRFENPDVCVLDLMLPELDGWKLIETARAVSISFQPSSSGSIRSSTQTSGFSNRSRASPSSPRPTTTGSKPAATRWRAIPSAITLSSSTMRILAMTQA